MNEHLETLRIVVNSPFYTEGVREAACWAIAALENREELLDGCKDLDEMYQQFAFAAFPEGAVGRIRAALANAKEVDGDKS